LESLSKIILDHPRAKVTRIASNSANASPSTTETLHLHKFEPAATKQPAESRTHQL
jgi:hypothetical protein